VANKIFVKSKHVFVLHEAMHYLSYNPKLWVPPYTWKIHLVLEVIESLNYFSYQWHMTCDSGLPMLIICDVIFNTLTLLCIIIVGIRWLSGCHFISTSTDQRMNIWKLHQDIALYRSCLLNVADVSTLELVRYVHHVQGTYLHVCLQEYWGALYCDIMWNGCTV